MDTKLSSHCVLRSYTDSKGEKHPLYVMNRDGFLLLANILVSNSSKVLKWEYIEAFDKIESEIRNRLVQNIVDIKPNIPNISDEAVDINTNTNMENLMNNNVQVMSSREIAQLTGKRHDNILRDCDNLNENYDKLHLLKIEEGYYTHVNTGNQQHREYLLTKIQTLDLMTGYNTELRIKVNRRWEELEKQNTNTVSLPNNYIEALEALLSSEKEKQQLSLENKIQSEIISEMTPKAEFADKVFNSKDNVDIGQAAKILELGFGIYIMEENNNLHRIFSKISTTIIPNRINRKVCNNSFWHIV